MERLKSYSIIYFLLIFFLTGAGLFAQNQWNLYSNANDINDVEIQGVNIWLATNGGGLVKFSRADASTVFYTKENSDLPGMIVNDVRTDGTSSIWVATDNGLAYFDGSDWKIYNTNNSDLPSNNVFSIDIDATGRKWIATDNGVAMLDGRNWTVYNIGNSDLPSNNVHQIVVKPTGSKWMCTDAGLVRFDGAVWTIYNTGNSDIPSDNVLTVKFQDPGVDIIIGTDAGVAFFNEIDWILYDTGNSNLPSNIVNDVAFDSNRGIWLATANGIAEFQSLNWVPFNSSNSLISSNFVNSLAIDTDDNIWIGTIDSLNKFKDSVWTKFFINQTFLTSNFINDIKTDNMGVAWFATPFGLASYNGVVWHYFEKTANYSCNNIAFDNNDNLWVATNKGVAKLNGDSFDVYDISNSNIPSNMVNHIVFDVFNNLWVGTDNGLAKFNGNNWTIYNTGNSGLPDNFVNYMIFEGNTDCWIATQSGLALFNQINWTVYDTGNSDLPSDFVSSVQIDNNGNKWIGMLNGGISFFNDTTFVNYSESNSDLVSNHITALRLDLNDNLWIGTQDSGLMQKIGTTFNTYNIANSTLPNNSINQLFADKANNLWISTGVGAAVFNGSGIKPSLFISYADTAVCAGNSIKVVFRNLFAFNSGNVFTVELSDANGNFDSPLVIGAKTSESTNGKDSIICLIPDNLQSGNGFRIRIRSSNPRVISEDNGFDIKIRELPKPEIKGRSVVCFNADESYSAPWEHNITYFWRAVNGTIIGDSTKNVVRVNWSNSVRQAYLILTETNELGCSDSLVLNVKIMGHPQMYIVGPKKVCAGRVYIYSSDTSHNIRYWSAVGGKVINMPDYNKVSVIWTAQEYGTLKLIEVTGGGCEDSVIYSVTIDPTPTADIDGPLEVREGDVAQYVTEQTASSIDKKWYVVNGEIVGDDNKDTVTVNWTKGGFGAIIQSQVSEAGCLDSNIVTVRIFENIEMLGLRNVCKNSVELYEANRNLGAYAQWSVVGGEIQGSSKDRICYIKWLVPGKGIIKLVQWIPNTSYKDSMNLNVNVNDIPPKPTITEHLDTLISSADVGNQWYWNGQIIPGANSKRYYTYQVKGNYTVQSTIAHNCPSPMSDAFSFISDVDEYADNSLVVVYPNPSDGNFTLNVNSDKLANFEYAVYNILGQKLIAGSRQFNGTHSEIINMQNFPTGIYYLYVSIDGKHYHKNLILNK